MSPARSKVARQTSNRLGWRAEWLAAAAMRLRGYRILDRGFTVPGGEIDIIARRGSVVTFVEVKARPSFEAAIGAVTPQKQRRIRRAASVWLARNAWAMGYTLRADVVTVMPRRWPRHVEDAFALDVG